MRRWPECLSLLLERRYERTEGSRLEGLLARRIKGALLISCVGPFLSSRTERDGNHQILEQN
jgi:hypothetical protein